MIDEDILTSIELDPADATGEISRRLLEVILALPDREYLDFNKFVDTLVKSWNKAVEIKSGQVEGGNH